MIDAHEWEQMLANVDMLVDAQGIVATRVLIAGILETLTHERLYLSARTIALLRLLAAQLWAGELAHEAEAALAQARAVH